MGRLIRNPIVYTFAAIALALLLASIFIGVRVSQSLQLIFIPYTYDITHGVGAEGAKIFAMVLGAAQIVLIVLIIVGGRLANTVAQWFVWGVGMMLAAAYFVVIVLGYLINNFH